MSPVGIGGAGFVGVAFETTAGTYVAPTKFFPIRSESLTYGQETNWRRPIRGIVDNLGGVAGYSHVEGDIEMEVLDDVLPWFLRASRNTVAKTGAGPYVYTFTPSAAATAPDKTLSVTIVRAGVSFGYTGCSVSSMEFGVDGSIATVTFSLIGFDETTQAIPTPTYANQTPYGAGQYNLQVPTATQIFDADGFSFKVEDNAEAQNRLGTTRFARFIKYGERNVEISMDRDFADRTEYDVFKALTAAGVTIQMTKGASNIVTLRAAAAVRDTYDLGGLSGQGDLIRATVTWQGTYDAATSKAYEIIVTTTENIV